MKCSLLPFRQRIVKRGSQGVAPFSRRQLADRIARRSLPGNECFGWLIGFQAADGSLAEKGL
jgi:hypothetical protein